MKPTRSRRLGVHKETLKRIQLATVAAAAPISPFPFCIPPPPTGEVICGTYEGPSKTYKKAYCCL